jgi:hypothetical protein
MTRLLNSVGDRLLGALVPKATAAAGSCQCWGGCSGSCWYECCITGTRATLYLVCLNGTRRNVGNC